MNDSDKPDCSRCAIRFDCDTAYTDKCWLVQMYMEQSKYIEQRIQEMAMRPFDDTKDINKNVRKG